MNDICSGSDDDDGGGAYVSHSYSSFSSSLRLYVMMIKVFMCYCRERMIVTFHAPTFTRGLNDDFFFLEDFSTNRKFRYLISLIVQI
jgi:hypothetical protein